MIERIFIKPATGMLVRKPVGGHLAATGEWQNADSYWLRRIKDGDALPAIDHSAHSATPADATPGTTTGTEPAAGITSRAKK